MPTSRPHRPYPRITNGTEVTSDRLTLGNLERAYNDIWVTEPVSPMQYFGGIESLTLNPKQNIQAPSLQNPYKEFVCPQCNTKKTRLVFDRSYWMWNGSLEICETCAKGLKQCQSCSKYGTEKDMKTVDRYTYCKVCVKHYSFTCDGCGKLDLTDNRFTTPSHSYCGDCFSKKYTVCSECRRTNTTSKSTTCEFCKRDICKDSPPCFEGHGIADNGCRHMTLPKFYSGKQVGQIITVDRFVGVELEAEEGDANELEEMDLPEGVDVGSDGSLNDSGVEVRTPPASLDKLEDIIEQTTKAMRKAGFMGTQAAGCHIHIGLGDIQNDEEKIRHIIQTFYAVEDLIYSMLPPSRWNNRYCKSLFKGYTFTSFAEKQVDSVWYREERGFKKESRKRFHGDDTRYSGINLHSLWYRGTIEFRYHSGTVSPIKILNWAQFLLLLVQYATERFDEKEIQRLLEMRTSKQKLVDVFSMLGMASDVREYIYGRTRKFNRDFKIQFNKGKTDEEVDTKKEYMKKELPLCIKDERGSFKYRIGEYSADESLLKPEDKEAYIQKRAEETAESRYRDYISDIGVQQKGFILPEELEHAIALISQGRQIQQDSASEEDRE